MPEKSQTDGPALRDRQLHLRIDGELFEAAAKHAKGVGVAAIVRALLRAYIRGAIALPDEDLERELTYAPTLRRRRARPTKGKGRPGS